MNTRWILKLRDREITFERPAIMGILNVTSDSFSGDGIDGNIDAAIERVDHMVIQGADIIDIGAESTRPGAEPISIKEELRRVVPMMNALVHYVDIPISIDTTKPEVAEYCLMLGAHIVNDVSGLRDERMRNVVAHHEAPVVIAHMQGTPQIMQDDPYYEHVIKEVAAYLVAATRRAQMDGIKQIIIDPGIGFGKNLSHNLSLLKHLGKIKEIVKCPLLVGVSRKGFIGAITGRESKRFAPAVAHPRLAGTLAAVTAAVLNGADIVRVHDVAEARDAVLVAHAIREAQ